MTLISSHILEKAMEGRFPLNPAYIEAEIRSFAPLK